MTVAEQSSNTRPASLDPARLCSDAIEYAIDAAQRIILFWDAMRQRGNQYEEEQKRATPNVLSLPYEIVMDGRTLPRPVNYGLVRIVPSADVEIDRTKRPFVIVDPRAGHGPGIGGFKADSEIGVAMRAGHPCYLVGFGPTPVPGQTIEDVAVAEAAFLERVIELHPEAEGKPAVVGNCQAGWAVMMLAAMRPDLLGPIIIAGSPLSYWNGVHGANPMRYTGGLLGGSWMAALASDLGNGTFDGASLVQNFENLNPANTLWTKHYNLYSKIDTEVPRYLEFEKYWDVPTRLTAAEIQSIVDKLFVGNKLSSGDIVTTDGTRVDLRAIRSPIVIFCSKGDNITPPQQALGWILDLYGSVDEIRMHDQTIVYAIHDSVGHLGIFVSGAVARKEHDEFASNIDLIDVLPPGLYEAVLQEKTPDDFNAALAHGNYIARFEARTLDDIRALGENDDQDERCFATVARLSEINYGLYRTLASPFVRATTNEFAAEALRRLQPLRLQNELASDKNLLMRPISALADQVRKARRPAAPDNIFLRWQEEVSDRIIESLNAWRDMRDRTYEQIFFGIYSLPALQAAVGEGTSAEPPRRRHLKEPMHQWAIERQIAELKVRMAQGGIREATVRAMLYVAGADVTADERMFAVLRQIRAEQGYDMSIRELKALVREQFFMLRVDEEAAVSAIRSLAIREPARIPEVLGILTRVSTAAGALSGEQATRLARVERLFEEASARPFAAPAKSSRALELRRDGRRKGLGPSEEIGDARAKEEAAGTLGSDTVSLEKLE